MDWDGCSINISIWGGMDLDPTLRGGLEMGLKICPMKTYTRDSIRPGVLIRPVGPRLVSLGLIRPTGP